MFERYTEKARRVIFFALYEASQLGSAYIETEHLLLGLLREDKRIVQVFFGSHSFVEEIRKKIEQHTIIGERVSTSVDLPLSNESKRVLAYAAEEAERLGHKHIGTEHLLLGLLREKKSPGALLLSEAGVDIENARKRVGEGVAKGILGGEGLRGQPARTVEIHGREFSYEYILKVSNAALKFTWIGRKWKPIDVVIDNEHGGISFDVSVADGTRFVLQPGGWTEEPCVICDWKLKLGDEGFTNGRRWVCTECYQRFVERKESGPSSWDST
jgi:Clp amino terminal domain, pathogenicity island component